MKKSSLFFAFLIITIIYFFAINKKSEVQSNSINQKISNYNKKAKDLN